MDRGMLHIVPCAPGSLPGAREVALCGSRLVAALAELLDDLGAERGQVVGLAARDPAVVHVDLLVDPRAARVADVGLQRGPRGERAALDDAGLDERPRAVADHADRLARLREPAPQNPPRRGG